MKLHNAKSLIEETSISFYMAIISCISYICNCMSLCDIVNFLICVAE
jgi:hypothetical protein